MLLKELAKRRWRLDHSFKARYSYPPRQNESRLDCTVQAPHLEKGFHIFA